MIVNCLNCSTRFELDDAKIPSHPFTVRCPNCAQAVNAQPHSLESREATNGNASISSSSAGANAEGHASSARSQEPAYAEVDVARMLSALMRRGAEEKTDYRGVMRKPSWERRRALICAGSTHGDEVIRALSASNYDVHVAENATQAFDQMREDRFDVIVLDTEFHLEGQGAALISREINSMRMTERRRTVFVHLSNTLRTGDAHGAFLSNVNLIVNTSEARQLPLLLEKNIRDLNELYRDFNRASNLTEL
jgi:predicted Zn finger-like uncharacterized protein